MKYMGARTNGKSRNETGNRDNESAREELLRAAKKLFARKGLSGTTIRDIAQEAGTNSSQISYYFEGKEGLYTACLQEITGKRLSFAEQILTPPNSQEEFEIRLRLFVENLMNHFLEDHDAGLIIIREFDRTHSPAGNVFKANFVNLLNLIQAFFKKAIDNGLINKKRDPYILMSLFFGTIMNELRFDHLKQDIFKRSIREPEERKKIIDHIVELFTI
jgi:AcrR family transcriptional regulator